jgi:hypothetical protein
MQSHHTRTCASWNGAVIAARLREIACSNHIDGQKAGHYLLCTKSVGKLIHSTKRASTYSKQLEHHSFEILHVACHHPLQTRRSLQIFNAAYRDRLTLGYNYIRRYELCPSFSALFTSSYRAHVADLQRLANYILDTVHSERWLTASMTVHQPGRPKV